MEVRRCPTGNSPFDETTTKQNRKQMVLLVRYWHEDQHQVRSKYLGSMFFVESQHITEMFMDVHGKCMTSLGSGYLISLQYLFNISSNSTNINKAIWSELDEGLKNRGYKGLLKFINCTLHTIPNAFRRAN